MDTTALRQFSSVVESIHAAALQPEQWPHTLERVAALQGAQRALLFTPALTPRDGGFVLAHAVPEKFLAEWANHYAPHDVWTAEALRRGPPADGEVMLGHELVPDAQLVASVFYRDFLSRMDIRRLCTGVVFSGKDAGLPTAACAMFRPSASKHFDETNRTLHGLLVRHLSQALGAVLRLRDQEFRLATSLQALDRLHTAVLLLGPRGNVLFANRNALRLLKQADGLALRSGNPLADALGWLQASRAGEQAALDRELRAALANDPLRPAHFAHGTLIRRTGTPSGLTVHAVPVAQVNSALWCRSLMPGALVFITDPQAVPRLDPAVMQRIYGISSAQCRVAQEVLRGRTVQETAQQLHLGENTVKTHLKQLFEKTHTSRQTELIRLLMDLAQQYGEGP